MTALKDALDALRPFAEVSLLVAYQSLPEGQYFDLYFADGDEACFNAFTVADLRRAAAVYAAIEKMMGMQMPMSSETYGATDVLKPSLSEFAANAAVIAFAEAEGISLPDADKHRQSLISAVQFALCYIIKPTSAPHKCFECGADLTVVCLRCNPLAEAPPPPVGDMVLVPREALVQVRVGGLTGISRHYKTCAIFQPSADEIFPKCDCGIGEMQTLIDSALAAAPLPAQEVTDAMVERALMSWFGQMSAPELLECFMADNFERMRAALQSALRPGKEGA